MFDTIKMMAKFSQAKGRLQDMKEKLPFIGVFEESPDGLIKIAITAGKEIKSIEINENMLVPLAKKDLEKKLEMTLNSAIKKAEEKYREEVKNALSDVFPEIAGFDLTSLGL
jgi:nucleoid-associated protein EbfC